MRISLLAGWRSASRLVALPWPKPGKGKEAPSRAGEERDTGTSHFPRMATIERLGQETGLWETTIRTDTEVLTRRSSNTTPRSQ